MQRHFFSLRIAALVVLAAILVGSIDLWVRGFAVIYDPDGRLASAVLVADGIAQPMREFADGYWAGRPPGEAHFELRCGNGAVRSVGYAAPGLQVTYRVSAGDCGPVAAPRRAA